MEHHGDRGSYRCFPPCSRVHMNKFSTDRRTRHRQKFGPPGRRPARGATLRGLPSTWVSESESTWRPWRCSVVALTAPGPRGVCDRHAIADLSCPRREAWVRPGRAAGPGRRAPSASRGEAGKRVARFGKVKVNKSNTVCPRHKMDALVVRVYSDGVRVQPQVAARGPPAGRHTVALKSRSVDTNQPPLSAPMVAAAFPRASRPGACSTG